jgi:hypothetical protein
MKYICRLLTTKQPQIFSKMQVNKIAMIYQGKMVFITTGQQ